MKSTSIMPSTSTNHRNSPPSSSTTTMTNSKTLTEKAVATAFPELVNMSDSSFLEHWTNADYSADDDVEDDAYSSQFFVDEDDDEDPTTLNISTTPSNMSIYTNDTTEHQKRNNDSMSLFHSPIKNVDRANFPFSPSSLALNTPTTADQSEWWTPNAQIQQHLHPSSGNSGKSNSSGSSDRKCTKSRVVARKKQPAPLHLVWWEKILIALALLGVVACVTISVAILVFQTTDIGGLVGDALSTSDTSTPAPVAAPVRAYSPYNSSNLEVQKQERFDIMRMWLELEDVSRDTSQFDALFWLAHADLPHVLGPLPSMQEYDQFYAPSSGRNDVKALTSATRDKITTFLRRLNQRYALLVLFYAVLEPVGGVTEGGWASVTGARIRECLWPGVVCSNGKEDYVIGLELDPNVGMLQGSLPTEIGLLSHLGHLEISYCNLTDNLPSTIYKLSNLTTLRLINNELSATLSPSIANLTKLASLELTNGGFVGSLPTQLGLLSNLKLLFLAQNHRLTGTIPTELARLERLERATFHSTSLSGTMPLQLCSAAEHRRKSGKNNASWAYLTANCDESTLTAAAIKDEDWDKEKPFIVCDCCTVCF